jgi:ATP-dependent helicase/nuclease subunit B
MHLLIGPPGSGKTTRLLEHARTLTQQGKRVWWVGLPSQRAYLYRRATDAGALLGLEFLSSQQVYYRLLANALKLKPLLLGTGRLALVGEALLQLRQELPAPGEARLFTRAIAEAKRFGLSPPDLPQGDAEVERFGQVFSLYEQIKGERWDYDDFRFEALKLASSGKAAPEADLIIVDGFRELGPLELNIYKLLAKGTPAEVWVSLPETPPGETPTEVIDETTASSSRVHTYRSANPVTEARWVLRSLKADLANGYSVLDLAVVLPTRQIKAFLSLADEYRVPLMNETPKALADTRAGSLLLDLLELPDHPSASKLLAIPELAPLANAALSRGLAGREALTVLAEDLGLSSVLSKWLGLLEVPDDELGWAKDLLDTVLSSIKTEVDAPSGFKAEAFRGHALERAKEAASLAKGAHFRAWWGALLNETVLYDRPRGGVALLDANLVSGRRFRKVYLMHALEGAYSTGEREDYFVPEEFRASLPEVFERFGLPKRFLGRDQLLYRELLSRGNDVMVTHSEADQGGPLVSEPALVGEPSKGQKHARLPLLLAASQLELGSGTGFEASGGSVHLGRITVQGLVRYDMCPFRYWAERRTPITTEQPWWRELVHELREVKKLNPARLELLKGRYMQASAWLAEMAEVMEALSFGMQLPESGPGPQAFLDAAGRSGQEVRFYRFVAPDRLTTMGEAQDYINGRWGEIWAAAHMLEQYAGRIKRVRIFVWPVLQTPVEAFEGGIEYVWRRMASKQQRVQRAFERFQEGDTSPKPGFHCRECRVSDVCRVGQR